MKFSTKIAGIFILLGFLVQSIPVFAQYAIRSSAFTNGSAVVTDTINYKLSGSAGQVLAGETGGSAYIASSGFWYQGSDYVVGIEDNFDFLPRQFELYQNYPNPFNPMTNIKFALPKAARVKIVVYNIMGQKVLTLLDEKRTAGYHVVPFNANHLSSGMYFYRIQAERFNQVKKMVLVK